jgi:hypothetical protein
LQSQTFDNASWTKSAAGTGSAPVVTANTAVAPDGTMTADTIVFALNGGLTSSDLSQLSQTVAALAGQGTWSVFLKTTDASTKTITLIAPSGDLQKLTVTGSWQRFSVSGSGGTLPRLRLRGDDTVSDSASLHIWGAQLEAASFPSSYIPTVAASATRAADVLTYTAGVSYPLQLWSEFERAVDTGGLEAIIAIDNGTTGERFNLRVATNDRAEATAVAGGVTQATDNISGSLLVGTVYKFAGRLNTNSMQIARGGTLGSEDTLVTLPATPTVLSVGLRNSSEPLFGYIRRIAVIQGAGTDANLVSMTT